MELNELLPPPDGQIFLNRYGTVVVNLTTMMGLTNNESLKELLGKSFKELKEYNGGSNGKINRGNTE